MASASHTHSAFARSVSQKIIKPKSVFSYVCESQTLLIVQPLTCNDVKLGVKRLGVELAQ